MAQPTNTFETTSVIGIREDLYEGIFNVDPDETPLLSAMPKLKASNTYHEWQTDALDAPSDSNAVLEGGDVTAEAITPTVRLGNYTQIFRKSVTISGTTNATNRAGRGSESDYQKMLKGVAMKTDMEMSIFANNARVAGDTVTPRELAGIPTWLTSNTDAGSGGSDAAGTGADARTDGTQRAFTEASLKTVLASIFSNSGKESDMAFVSPFNKQVQSGFTGNSTRMDRGEDKKVFASVDVYEHDFGTLRFIPSRHVRSRDCIIVRSDMWAWAELRPMFDEKLAKTGDSEKFAIWAEATLVCRNEKASGIVADLTTS